MDTQEILEKLKFNTGSLPREALQEAIANPEKIIPELLNILKYTTENLQEIAKNLEETGYIQNLFALYLLAQFREKQAYPLIIEFISIPGKLIFDVTGDLIYGDLCRILASVSCGDVQLLPPLIENPNIDENVRSAALATYPVLMFVGEISREEVIKYFRYLYHEGLEKEHSNVWNELVSCSSKIYPKELYQEIKKAYEENLIDSFFIRIEDIEEALAEGQEKTFSISKKYDNYTLIEDVIAEMKNWACFKTKKELEQGFNKVFDNLIKASIKGSQNQKKLQAKKEPTRAEKARKKEVQKASREEIKTTNPPKIGRNRPCPCGSGKKYKKCCLMENN